MMILGRVDDTVRLQNRDNRLAFASAVAAAAATVVCRTAVSVVVVATTFVTVLVATSGIVAEAGTLQAVAMPRRGRVRGHEPRRCSRSVGRRRRRVIIVVMVMIVMVMTSSYEVSVTRRTVRIKVIVAEDLAQINGFLRQRVLFLSRFNRKVVLPQDPCWIRFRNGVTTSH
uniref:(northern house mosquito) hypothetical protein n=1 Tax=Culex pipiens TaxID=7175 RepID=A0A8D8HWG4_CULPI